MWVILLSNQAAGSFFFSFGPVKYPHLALVYEILSLIWESILFSVLTFYFSPFHSYCALICLSCCAPPTTAFVAAEDLASQTCSRESTSFSGLLLCRLLHKPYGVVLTMKTHRVQSLCTNDFTKYSLQRTAQNYCGMTNLFMVCKQDGAQGMAPSDNTKSKHIKYMKSLESCNNFATWRGKVL